VLAGTVNAWHFFIATPGSPPTGCPHPTAGKSVCFTGFLRMTHSTGDYRLMTGDDLKIFEVKNKKIEKA
jgi:BRCT domain type II-containing protein